MTIELLGMSAGLCTTVAFWPQVVKTWKSRSAKDLSLGMFLIFTSGVAQWTVYGAMTHDLPILAANSVTLLLSATLLYFKLRWKDR